MYGTRHKKLYDIRRFTALVIGSFSAASSRISAESSKGVHRIVKGFCEIVKGIHGIVLFLE